jgi:hypothetical protein
LLDLVLRRTANEATHLPVDENPAWADNAFVNHSVQAKASEHNWHISLSQWIGLSNLQRFALMKLSKPGHEQKNFPKAMKEFNLVQHYS